jgi:hypothetical protein
VNSSNRQLLAAAIRHGLAPERIAALLGVLRHRLGGNPFYVFRASGGAGGTASGRSRQVVAFATADAALSFAQCNAPGKSARVRALSVEQLLTILLQEPRIAALLFVVDGDAPLPPGCLPDGLRLRRDEVLRALGEPGTGYQVQGTE